MSETLKLVQSLAKDGRLRISEHGRDELAADGIALADIFGGIATAQVVEDYPEYYKGPSVLCLQRDRAGKPIHALWGIAARTRNVATLITAYRPDPARWSDDLLTRKRR